MFEKPRVEFFANKWRVAGFALLFVAIAYLGYLDWEKRDYAWRLGYVTCIDAGHDEPVCKKQVARHNEQCFAITGSDEFRNSTKEIMNVDLYVECVILGPAPFKKMMRQQRRDARRSTTSTTTTF